MYIGGITEIQVHMRKLLLTFSLITGIILLLQGQSAALQNQIAADKNELTLDFYELLDGGDPNQRKMYIHMLCCTEGGIFRLSNT